MNPYHHIDMGVLLAAVGGDVHAYRQLMLIYLEVAPPMHGQLQQAMLAADCAAAAYAAHALKGSTVLVGAGALTAALQALELMARAGDGALLAPAGAELARLFGLALDEVLHCLAASVER